MLQSASQHTKSPSDSHLVPERHGPFYARVEQMTPTFAKAMTKRAYYRIRRRIDRWRAIERERFVEFGHRFRFDRRAPHKARVGARTIVEDDNVWNAEAGDICVGRRCWFGLHNVVMGPVEIGDGLTTGQFVAILGPRRPASRERGRARTRTVIGRNVWISTGAIVLFGVSIGDNAVIGAGATVVRDVPPDTMFIQRAEETYISLEPLSGIGPEAKDE